MSTPHHPSSKGQFWIGSGVLLIVVGVVGTILPLFGLQLRRLEGIPLGVWTGVPFIALGLAMIGLTLLSRRHPKLMKRAFIGTGVLMAGLIALAVIAPMLAGRGSGTIGSGDGGVEELARRYGVDLPPQDNARGVDNASRGDAGVRPGDAGDQGSDRRGDPFGDRQGPRGMGPGRDRPETPPMPEGSWSIIVERRIMHEEGGPIREALRALSDGSPSQYQRSQRGDRTTFRIWPINDVAALRETLERFGVIDEMDTAAREIRMTITTLDP